MSERTIAETALLVVKRDVLAADFGAEQVMLNLEDGVYYGLEDVGALVWRLLQQPTTVAAIRDAITDAYDVEADRCERDVRALLADLLERGLVELRR